MRTYRSTASTFVDANPPAGELDPIMEMALTQSLERNVLVPVFQNFAGGVGVFAAIVAVMFWRIDYGQARATTLEVLVGASYWGFGAFGVACAVRAFRDEVCFLLYHWSRGWAEGRTNKELDRYIDECDRLQQENRQLSVANAQMVRHVRATTDADILPPAPPRLPQDEYVQPLHDALSLCRYQDAHGKISRDAVVASGAMDRSRWESAKRLLEHSGVVVANGVIGESPSMARIKVREFVDNQRQMPAGFVAPNVG